MSPRRVRRILWLRIVADVNRRGQDELVRRVVAEFSEESRMPRVIDRREVPSQGYTAVHVVVFPDGIPVEVQVRTTLQHEWAEMFEKLADRVGRSIRYGSPPDHWDEKVRAIASERDLSQEQLEILERLYDIEYELRVVMVEEAITAGKLIGAVEAAEMEMADDEIESEYEGSRNIEIVALEADSEEAMRSTHARYFLTLSELADRIA
jgi:tetrahydromethanopterin S-methyltransferase subunit G